MKKQIKGFMALFSVIIISSAIMLVAVSLSFSGFYARFNIFDSELKERSNALAQACTDSALLMLAGDTTFSQSMTSVIQVGSDSCDILTIERDKPSVGQSTIFTHATVSNTHTYYKTIINTTSFKIISYEELPTY